ncbi:MAG: type II secretion system protein [Elusimicrobiota bacterium]
MIEVTFSTRNCYHPLGMHRRPVPSRKRPRGFTLIEMMIVITIIGILTSVIVPKFVEFRKTARDAKRLADVRNFMKVMEMYRAENDDYAGEGDATGVHISPKCPSDLRDDLELGDYYRDIIADPLDGNTGCTDNSDLKYFYGWDSTHMGGRQWCFSVNRLETQAARDKLQEIFGEMKAISQGSDANIDDAEFNYCFIRDG